MSDPTKLEDFKGCQQYLSTLIPTMLTQAKTERHINAVKTNGGGGGGPNPKSLVDKVKGGVYTDAQFYALTPKEKDRVKKYRSTMQRKTNTKQKQANKRKLAKAKTDRDDSVAAAGEEDDRTDSGAGSQFGVNGNRNKKQKK
jgi:hypothetical protein